MAVIKQWAFSVCAAMVACGLAQMLLPNSGMEKIFRTTVSVFFLCCLLSPLLLQNPGLHLEIQEYTQADIEERAARLGDEVDRQAGRAVMEELQKIVQQKLAQMGINYLDITINIITNGQSEAEALEVMVLLDTAYESDHEQIAEQLAQGLGAAVHLQYIDTGGGA